MATRQVPAADVEKRVQEKLAKSLQLRRYSFTFSTVLLLLLIGVELCEGAAKGYLLVLWFLILFCAVVPIYKSFKRRRSLVLWIRRFHRGPQSRLEQQLLEGAVNPWGRLVTLADSNIQSASGTRSVLWIVTVLGLLTIAGAALGLIRQEVVYSSAAFLAFYTFRWMTRGKTGLQTGDWMQKLASLKSRSLPPGLSGVVLNCPQDSELWRNVIENLAPLVDAVVISAPENTPQLEWEMKTLGHSLGSSKMIVLKHHTIPQDLSLEPMQELEVPNPVSWWHDYLISYFGASWKKAMSIVLRAIESDRPNPGASL